MSFQPARTARRVSPLWLLAAAAIGFVALAPLASVGAKHVPTITFFVASDSHFGARGMEALNREVVRQLNALPGTPYPPAMGGVVQEPRGVLFLGDMTDSGRDEEWRLFEQIYGLTGRDGLLRFPIFEALGNHDFTGPSRIKEHIAARHGSVVYSWDWDDLHLVCLDMHPDASNLEWLARDLHAVGPERPVLLFFHYSLEGPYSDFWEEADKDAFARALVGYNVIAILHGHYHRAGHYVWRGHNVFRPGAPRHSSHVFLAVRLGDRQIEVAYRDFDREVWTDVVARPVRR